MTECTALPPEASEVSLLPLNEEVDRVEKLVECNNMPLPDEAVIQEQSSVCSDPNVITDNANVLLSVEQLSTTNNLPSQTVENISDNGCINGMSGCDGAGDQCSGVEELPEIGPAGDKGKTVSSTDFEESIDYIDSMKRGSSSSGESSEVRKTDSPQMVCDMSRESSECRSISPRDTTNSAMSVDSKCEDSVLETVRLGAESAMSDVSNQTWLREETVISVMSVDSQTSSGMDEDGFVSARESVSTTSSGSDRVSEPPPFKPGELTNQLVEGPRITLPPSELPVIPSYPVAPDHGLPITSRHAAVSLGVSSAPSQSKPSNSTHASALGEDSDLSYAEVVKQKDLTANNNTETGESVMHSEQAKTVCSATDAERPSSSTASTTSNLSNQQTTQPPSKVDNQASAAAKPKAKRTPNDFIFGKVIGEGSYSTVYLAKEVSAQKEFAIKVCDKKHLIRERKTHFVMREKEVLMKLDHPFFIKLAYTFQDSERLYYVLTYARNGELLGYLHKLSAFDVPCTRFYSAELVLALEYLHGLGIIHRDLKPENILLSEDMHIKITDFGTSKILSTDSNGNAENSVEVKRKNSFVGTAEYVSPEVLNNLPAHYGADLWALGCIIYQCLSGSMPFRSGNEYQTFQKIVKAEYDVPEGFHPDAKDLVSKLLVIESTKRLGASPPEGMNALKAHPFYAGIDWEGLPQAMPPKLMPYLPATAHNPEFWGQEQRRGPTPTTPTGFDDQRLAEIITGQTGDGSMSPELEEIPIRGFSQVEEDEKTEKLKKQRQENQFHQFVEDNLILRQGFVDKRKGLFARKRMLLLTEGPHLYYVDAHNKVLKGEIPWSKYLRPEAKNFKIFFVHTPNRTYYLESRQPDAQQWVKQIKEVWKRYYGPDKDKK